MAGLFEPRTRSGVVPRDYQNVAHDECFRLWDAGHRGCLMRMATGLGKTLTSCLVADTWNRRADNHRVMVISYETQLVEQWAEEIEDFLGVKPGIEMDSLHADESDRIVVASRASLLRAKPPTAEQLAALAELGVVDFGCLPGRMAETYLRHLRKGGDLGDVIADIEEKNRSPFAANGGWSRLHRFDWRLNWLVIFDEAHRHAYHLKSCGHITDWFEQNPAHRRLGPTATPKRSDQVSIGHKQFPAVCIDYPLYSAVKECAVKSGWAVPYIQRYIEVEGVDFRSPHLLDSKSESGFDDEALARELETRLASFVGPMLDMVGDRRTLIFCVDVAMTKAVAQFINARCRAKCECGCERWHPKALIDDGATCTECGRFITKAMVNRDGEQARSLDGSTQHKARRPVYAGHRGGEYQFLAVCGLCREGYDDPGISCVACFRPVSKKASSLAEQMKGRGCRVIRELARLLHTLADAQARIAAIASSAKPNTLIVDLVGITGLGDCPSTLEIYAEGLPDEVKERAEELLAQAKDEELDLQTVLDVARDELAEEKERARIEREEAEKRAREEAEKRSRGDARARYSEHEVGYGVAAPLNGASDGQVNYLAALGFRIIKPISKKQAGRMIDQLKQRIQPEEVARTNGLGEGDWKIEPPTPKQQQYLDRRGIEVRTKFEAGLVIGAQKNPEEFEQRWRQEIDAASNEDLLTGAAKCIAFAKTYLRGDVFARLVGYGQARRKELQNRESF